MGTAYRGVLFDLDGTLADTPGAIAAITHAILRDRGLTLDASAVLASVGRPLDQNFAHRWTLDLSADYNLDHWTFSAGADNVTNAKPEQVKYANSTNGNFKYSLFSPLSWNGRYYYASVTYRWK